MARRQAFGEDTEAVTVMAPGRVPEPHRDLHPGPQQSGDGNTYKFIS